MQRLSDQGHQRDIDLRRQGRITMEELKELYEDYIQLSPTKSTDYLIKIVNQIESVDANVFTDPLFDNHEFYTLITNQLQDVLNKWNESNRLTESESFLFHYIIRILCKIKASPDQLIQIIEKCFKDMANDGRFLYDNDNMKDFSNLVGLYTQNEQIMEAIVQCLSSEYYIKMFQSTKSDDFLLFKCPMYWMNYRASRREEFANMLLDNLLVSTAHILQQNSTKQWQKALTQLLNLLSYNLTLCTMSIFESDQWMKIINVLFPILKKELLVEESRSLIKSIIHLLLILMNNNQRIFHHVKQFQELFQTLIDTEDEACLLLTLLMSDSEIQIMINNNKNFALVLRKYLHEENNRIKLLIERLKLIVEVPVNEEETAVQRVAPTTLQLQSMVVSNENKNQEEVTLIWYDKNVGGNDDTKKTVELLQQINDYVLICSNREKCIEYTEQIKTEKVFLILSGSSAEDILEEIHHRKQIDSIFIFCIKRAKYQTYLNNDKFYKVVGIYTEYEPLLSAIQENIRHLIKQSEAAGLFDQDERSMRNLNRESYLFNYFLAFKHVLPKTTYNNEMAKREMIEVCQNYYRNNRKELLNIDEFERTYRSEDAIYWYTKQSFIYRLVNKALRTEDYQAMLVLRFFIVDLCENLRQKYQDLKEHSQNLLSYRGLKLTPPEIYNLKHSIDATIATNGFLSTSRSKDVAYKFAKKGTKRPNLETVMLEINVDLSKIISSIADIAQYSDYPEEQEILFDLGASFIINSVDYDNIQKIWLVKLEGNSEESTINDIQTLLKNYHTEGDMNILLGKLLYKMEKNTICRKYFENLKNFYGNEEHEALGKIYDFIGRTSCQLLEFDKAIINYTKALDYYILLNRLEDAARVTNLIGFQYAAKDDKDNARLYYQKSHEIWKQLPTYTSENPHCEIGRLMSCFGLLEDNHQIACDYLLKALRIYENPSEACEHTDDHDFFIAPLCEILAEKYYADNNYDKAFEYIMKNVSLRRKNLSAVQERENYFWCLFSLKRVCKKTHADVWPRYEKELDQLVDIDLIQSYPELQNFFDSTNNLRRLNLPDENTDNNASTEFLEHSLKSLKHLLKKDPNNYEKIIQAHIDIGLAYAKAKDYDWSSQHYETALEMCQKYLPTDTKHVSTIFEYLSDINLYKNNFDHAISLRMKSLTINEETCHLTEKENEAQCYFDIAKKLPATHLDKTLEFYSKSLEIREQIFPENHVNIGFCHHFIGHVYRSKDMFDTALEYHKRANEIYEKHLSDDEKYQFNVKILNNSCYSSMIYLYCRQNKYDDAFDLKLKTLSIDEKFSHLSDKEKQAQCYFDLGGVLFEREIEKALEFSQKSLEIREEVLPKDDINIGFSHQDIGAAYEKKCIYDIALEHYTKASEISEKHLFDQEEYQFNVKNMYNKCQSNLVRIYCHQRKYDDALICRIKALGIDEKYYHLTDKEKEAQCYFDVGNDLFSIEANKALEFYQKSLQIREEILPADHVNIGFCYHNIGRAYKKKCIFDISIEYYTKAVEIYKKHLFDKDEYQFNIKQLYIGCYSNLVKMYCQQRKYNDALACRRKILSMNEKYGHLTEKEKEAQCYFDVGNELLDIEANKALEFYQKSLELRQQILPNDHVSIGFCYQSIGSAYEDKCKFDIAIEHYTKAIEVYEKHLLDKEEYQFNVIQLYGQCYNSIGGCHSSMKKSEYVNAMDYTLKAIEIYQQYCPENKNNIAQCYWNYGYILKKKGKYGEAITQIQKSLDTLLYENTIDIGRSYHLLGNCYYEKLEYEQALAFYEKALKNYEECLMNLNNKNARCALYGIALCLFKLNKYEQSLEYAIKSHHIREQIFPLMHVERPASHSLLALIYSRLQQNEKCHEHHIKGLEILKQLISNGESTEGLDDTFENIGELYINRNNLRKARKYYKKTLKFKRKDKLDGHPDIERIQKIIDEISTESTTLEI